MNQTPKPQRGFDDDYIPVNERLQAFYARFPEGSIQTEIVELTGERVITKSLAYRTPDDPRPAVGHAWEVIPGPPPYTKGSELMVAETSSAGRAIAMLGIAASRSIASREEVEAARARQAADEDEAAVIRDEVAVLMAALLHSPEEIEAARERMIGLPVTKLRAGLAKLRERAAAAAEPEELAA